jgi:hypothetical protein
MTPPRITLYDFPDVVIHADESVVKRHPQYAAAKAGDVQAAQILATELVNPLQVERLMEMTDGRLVELVPVHALESEGVNEIPAALGSDLSGRMGLPVNRSMVQTNSVGHTSAGGFERLARQARFEGQVKPGQLYLLVDDFVGQGGTLANLIGFISTQGGQVMGATVLTGKPFSAMLAPDEQLIQTLRAKHGRELEAWWNQNFGFDFERLTRSEARYLEKSADAHTIRDRIAAAGFKGST